MTTKTLHENNETRKTPSDPFEDGFSFLKTRDGATWVSCAYSGEIKNEEREKHFLPFSIEFETSQQTWVYSVTVGMISTMGQEVTRSSTGVISSPPSANESWFEKSRSLKS